MSKKSKKGGRGDRAAAPRPVTAPVYGRKRYYAAALCALILLVASVAATRLEPVRRAVGLQPLAVEPAQQGQLSLSKEYVYAGGRLVATEEPTATPSPTPSGPSPSALTATGFFPTSTTALVKLVWSAPSGATPISYVVERASGRNANGLTYQTVGSPVATLPTQANPYIDQTAAADAVYVYRVRAAYAGSYSGYSNQDIANTIRYSGDDPLIGANDPQQRPASVVRAAALNELRAVIDTVRSLAGVGTGTWKNNPAPAFGGSILKDHFAELRTNLDPALASFEMTPVGGDPSIDLNQPVKAAHLQGVRDKLR